MPSNGRNTPPASNNSGFFFERSAHEVDEQAALLTGWDQSYAQMSSGTFTGTLAQARLEDTGLFVEFTARRLCQSGSLPADRIAIGVPMAMSGVSVFCGAKSHAAAVHVFSGRQGFEFYSPERLVMAGFVVPREALSGMLSPDEDELVTPALNHAHLMTIPNVRIEAMRAFAAQVFDALRESPGLLDEPAARQSLASAVQSNLATMIVGDGGHGARQQLDPSRRWHVIAAAREILTSRPHQPVAVGELCRRLNLSRRSLQYCFEEELGLSPVVFLRALRLNGVRRALRSADSVTDAATQWGFWHFGHFSNDYKELFGELPSQTLRRHRVAALAANQ